MNSKANSCEFWFLALALGHLRPSLSAMGGEMAQLSYFEYLEVYDRLRKIWVFTAYSHRGKTDIRKVHNRNLMYFPECK